jgi:hypothetical protein
MLTSKLIVNFMWVVESSHLYASALHNLINLILINFAKLGERKEGQGEGKG